MGVKSTLKTLFPSVHRRFALARVYLRDGFLKERWNTYYDGVVKVPERCLEELKPRIPDHIDTFLNLGCGAGREFQTFDGEMKLWGIDIVPPSRIRWVKPFKNLTYEQCSVEELTKRLERREHDLTHTLIYSSGVLMYVSPEGQKRFYDACLASGCRNFIFQEYAPGNTKHPFNTFEIPQRDFEVIPFRSHKGEGQPVAYVRLEQKAYA